MGITLAVLLCLTVLSFKAELSLTAYPFPDLKFFPSMPSSSSNPVTVEGARLGRYLFYDPILSGGSKLSCAGCHKQTNAFSDAPNTFSKGFDNVPQKRNTPPLFNLAWYHSLFWDGRATDVEDQVLHPVRAHDEMHTTWADAARRIESSAFYQEQFALVFPHQKIDSNLIARAIAQFERTLLSYRSKYDSALRGEAFLTADEVAGFEIVNDMTRGDCLHCHSTDADALGTTLAFSNNGLDAAHRADDYSDKGRGGVTKLPADQGKFKIPSLRNLAFTAPYMHDGRFKTLAEVLDFYSEGVKAGINTDSKMEFAHTGGVHLSKEDKRKVLAFLSTLNDYVFVNDSCFSNPFPAN